MRVFFVCTPALSHAPHDLTCTVTMDLDTPFSDIVTWTCAALDMREHDWVWLFDPWEWRRIPPGRTPLSYNMNHNDVVWIYGVPVEANN